MYKNGAECTFAYRLSNKFEFLQSNYSQDLINLMKIDLKPRLSFVVINEKEILLLVAFNCISFSQHSKTSAISLNTSYSFMSDTKSIVERKVTKCASSKLVLCSGE